MNVVKIGGICLAMAVGGLQASAMPDYKYSSSLPERGRRAWLPELP